MKYYFLTLTIILFSMTLFAQNKKEYLEKNRFDLNSKDFSFPQTDFNIIGFGAYHGSAKTENVEIDLIKSLLKNKSIKYYLPETDFSIAHYFNEFLINGDTVLLKDLIKQYGIRVPQERSVEVYEKWKELKNINDQLPENKKIKVIGIDFQVNYKYVSKHILELINDSENELTPINEIKKMVKIDTTSFSLGDKSYAYMVLKKFVEDYENNKESYEKHILNKIDFRHIIKNLRISFTGKIDRDKIMFENYLTLDTIYNFKNNPQFLRMGFFHLEKSREGKNSSPSFFTRLIENNFYKKNQIVSIIGYLTKSHVLWNTYFDKNGKYTSYNTFGGYGIGDYWKEYFRGISKLKRTKISDLTLFRLNKPNSPYNENKPDLIEIKMPFKKSNSEQVKGMSTLDFLDYAVLISHSKASTPIYELK